MDESIEACMYGCVCMYVCVHSSYICTHTYIHTHIQPNSSVSYWICLSFFACMHICVCTSMHHTHTHTHTHTPVYICIHLQHLQHTSTKLHQAVWPAAELSRVKSSKIRASDKCMCGVYVCICIHWLHKLWFGWTPYILLRLNRPDWFKWKSIRACLVELQVQLSTCFGPAKPLYYHIDAVCLSFPHTTLCQYAFVLCRHHLYYTGLHVGFWVVSYTVVLVLACTRIENPPCHSWIRRSWLSKWSVSILRMHAYIYARARAYMHACAWPILFDINISLHCVSVH
jgi:hypothetical protein